MNNTVIIKKGSSQDLRFNLTDGAGSDAIHITPVYAYAVCKLETDKSFVGTGIAFTLGAGNSLVCQAIDYLVKKLEGLEINELMAEFGLIFQRMADDPNLRWLGPHKGVVHLALASVTNACFDLWAKSRGLPLWKLLIDLAPTDLINCLDFSYLEDVLTKNQALKILQEKSKTKEQRMSILESGYPGYDTSVGWFNYDKQKITHEVKKAISEGFSAMKLKVGSKDLTRDLERASLVRDLAGDDAMIMLDVNQQWNYPQAVEACSALSGINPFWIEEPTHPDDVWAHKKLIDVIYPVKVAAGEHVPNRVIFKNYICMGAFHFNQVDAVRVGGISEFITISILSKKYNIPVVPHVGDMGQIHQHLVLFNHISLGHEVVFLEYIPHLKMHFKNPAQVENGYYKTPQDCGISVDFLNY